MSNQWGEYMTLLATPGLPSCSNTDYLAGTSNPDYGAGTSNTDFGAEPTQSHTPLSENFIPHENDAEDSADSFVNESDEASELDEAEYPIPPEDGLDHVDINTTFYRSIPFFEQTFPEIPADSVDVPNLRYAKFYNKSEGRLDKGMLFKTKEELMEAVKDHSIRHARSEYYVTESSKTKWKVLCKHSTEGQWCKWEVRGGYKPKIRRWEITVYKGTHTCVNMSLSHGNINRVYIASLHLGHVKCSPSYGIKYVIQNVKDQTGYDVPYQKAWYSLKMTREIVYGTWECSVQKLPKYLGAIKKYNPGTIVEWKHKGFQQSTGKYVMGYVFWAFKQCIDGFQFCRKIISVDGTHLYTKYKHKLLIAAAMDGSQQVLPLAFAIVDEETYPCWKWFLQQLSRHVIRGRRGMCLISNRHGGLIIAVREGPDFVSPHGVHRYCLRHVCSNFNSIIKNVVLKDLCWQAGSEYQLRKFNRIMEEIKKQSVKAFAYLDQINKEKWTASLDGGWRCGILTTNMSECINGVLKGARRLPVSALVEITLERTVHYFRVRAIKGHKMLQNNQLWTDFACKMFISWQQKAVEHTVTKYSHAQQSASVVTRRQIGHGMNTHVVKIAN
ncbi:hypothetical protein Sango_0372400 [Sesamum angolense]|uniref:MULE transposase domain-containing protein n=1 Tax=Sesamum angolense TaxID=2727404 RepID=A0AAE2C3Q0_9LAMI|nr:hypothetical protein Sango_0372400 [Sesamum angolense]